MRGIVAKKLMKEARLERSIEREVPERDLAQKKSGAIINHPYSVRATYLSLKGAFAFASRFSRSVAELKFELSRMAGEIVKAVRQRTKAKASRKGRTAHQQPEDRIMTIQKPLMLILQHCPPDAVRDASGVIVLDPVSRQPTYQAHPIYVAAQRAAARGRGDLVQSMARQFLPA